MNSNSGSADQVTVWWKCSIAVSNVDSAQLWSDDLEIAGLRAAARQRSRRLRAPAQLCKATVSRGDRLAMRSRSMRNLHGQRRARQSPSSALIRRRCLPTLLDGSGANGDGGAPRPQRSWVRLQYRCGHDGDGQRQPPSSAEAR